MHIAHKVSVKQEMWGHTVLLMHIVRSGDICTASFRSESGDVCRASMGVSVERRHTFEGRHTWTERCKGSLSKFLSKWIATRIAVPMWGK